MKVRPLHAALALTVAFAACETPNVDTPSTHVPATVILRTLGGSAVHIRPASAQSAPTVMVEYGDTTVSGNTAMRFVITVPKDVSFQVADAQDSSASRLALTEGKNEVHLVRAGAGVRFEAASSQGATAKVRDNASAAATAPEDPSLELLTADTGDIRRRVHAIVGDQRTSFLLIEKK